jgi:hypothetical protein
VKCKDEGEVGEFSCVKVTQENPSTRRKSFFWVLVKGVKVVAVGWNYNQSIVFISMNGTLLPGVPNQIEHKRTGHRLTDPFIGVAKNRIIPSVGTFSCTRGDSSRSVELTPGAVWFLNKICLPLLPSVVSSLKK